MSRAVEEINRRMLRARDAMDRAYADPLDVPGLARVANVSEAHFIRTFRATFGETPHRYLQRRRVERAMFLLRATERSVTDICLRRRLHQPRYVQPQLSRHRRRGADRIPRARADRSRPDVLRDGLDTTEQFWRSQGERHRLAWDPTSIPISRRSIKCSTLY